MWQTFLLLS